MACLVAAAALAGCGQPGGWLIRPVPGDRALRETVIRRDAGLFVTDKIALVDLDGLIVNERSGGLFGVAENPVSLFAEKIDKAQADPHVRALLLRINSPGGGVTATDILYQRVQRFRAARPGVPVLAVIEDVGASGGYYLACAADEIVVHPTSITGSIGVLVQTVSFAGTMEKLGIAARAVTSGPRKDLASPLKPLDEKDLAVLQGIVDRMYARFLEVVKAGRKDLPAEKVRELADGRVWTGERAVELGLADATGFLDDALGRARQRAGADRVKVVMYHRPLGYRANAYSRANLPAAAQLNLLNVNIEAADVLDFARPRFLYLWTGRR